MSTLDSVEMPRDPVNATVRIMAITACICLGSCTSAGPEPKTSPSPAASDTASSLRRPLLLPEMGPGSGCPRTTGRQMTTGDAGGFALGNGPAFPIVAESRDRAGVFHFGEVRQNGEWWPLKTLWVIDPSEDGPVLLRAARLWGGGEIALAPEQGAERLEEIQTSTGTLLARQVLLVRGPNVSASGWREFPGATYISRSGCYGFQVDGRTFSYSIVFEAAL